MKRFLLLGVALSGMFLTGCVAGNGYAAVRFGTPRCASVRRRHRDTVWWGLLPDRVMCGRMVTGIGAADAGSG